MSEKPTVYSWRYATPLGVFFLLIIVLATGIGKDPALLPSTFIDKKLPEFSLPLLKDETQTQNSNAFDGKVWILNVWASWCIPCLQEHPQITWLSNNDIPVVGLNYKDKKQEALDWLETNGDPFSYSLVDGKGKVGIELGVYGVPETFLVNANGIVLYKHVGPLYPDDAKKIMELVDQANQNK